MAWVKVVDGANSCFGVVSGLYCWTCLMVESHWMLCLIFFFVGVGCFSGLNGPLFVRSTMSLERE